MDEVIRKIEREFLMSPNQELLARMGAALGRVGDVTLASWLQFLSGHWTLEAPTREGSYFTKTRQDELGGLIHVITLDGQLVVPTVTMRISPPSDRWSVYWWSEPMPTLPVHNEGL